MLIIILVMLILRNKRIETNDIPEIDSPKEYTIFVTDSFTEEDSKYMRPIFTLNFIYNGDPQEAILCYVLNEDGEEDLDEAGQSMINNIQGAFAKNIFIDAKVNDESLQSNAEKQIVDLLCREIVRLKN